MKLTGPFKQIVTLANLPLRGKLSDDQLEIIEDGGILTDNGKIIEIGNYEALKTAVATEAKQIQTEFIEGEQICMPAFTDSHTHICFGGNRANDFAMRNAGKT
ncbi:MAG: imidazolonepropionase, partial [Kaistella sp.]